MTKRVFAFWQRLFFDQRGEVGDDITEPDDGAIDSEIDDPGYVAPDPGEADEDDDEGTEDPGGDPDEDKPDDEDDDPLEKLKSELKQDFDSKLAEKDKEINKIGYALRKATEKGKGDDKGDEPQFSDSQLLGILKEHKDDETVLLQVMKEIADSKGKEVEKSAERAADIKTKTIDFDKFLTQAYPDFQKDDTEQAQAVERAVDWLHLEGHPFAKYLAISTMQFQHIPKLIEQAKEEAKKEFLSKKADDTRKEKIKNNAPAGTKPPEGGKPPTLSAQQSETAKLIFGNDERLKAKYAKMIGKKDGTYTANVQ